MTLAELIEKAQELDPEEQIELAHRVLLNAESLAGDQLQVDAAWAAEIDSRVDDILSAKVVTVPFREVDAKLKAKIAAAQR